MAAEASQQTAERKEKAMTALERPQTESPRTVTPRQSKT